MKIKRVKIESLCSLALGLALPLVLACGSTESGTPSDAHATSDVATADDVTDLTDIADTGGVTRDSLCATLQKRINACGHTYTFPGFTPWCTDESRDDTELLTTCSIRPCALLVECLQSAKAPSEGL